VVVPYGLDVLFAISHFDSIDFGDLEDWSLRHSRRPIESFVGLFEEIWRQPWRRIHGCQFVVSQVCFKWINCYLVARTLSGDQRVATLDEDAVKSREKGDVLIGDRSPKGAGSVSRGKMEIHAAS